jgi:pyruvate dehydrogenase E2 component (dihydrolipoamide acetyltransferase)
MCRGEDAAAIKEQYGAGKPGAADAKQGEAKQKSAAPKQELGQEGTTRPEATANVEEARQEAAGRPIPQEQRQPSPVSDVPAGQPAPARVGEERIVASPLAKRMAADLGVDLAKVQGTGPGGRIVQKDIEDAAAAAKQAGTKPTSAGVQPEKKPTPMATFAPKVLTGQNQVVPLTKMRATIAQRLQASKQGLPHFYETIDIDCENVMALRGRLNAALEKEGVRLSLADFIAKALVAALQQHPVVNSTFDGKQVTMHGDVNLGMAVALPAGLIVPVLRGVNQMGLKEIRMRTADLIDRARQQRLKQEEMTGGTFTISNLGNYGVREFTAIINPPEVAILAIGAAEKRPVCKGDQIVARTMMSVTLSSDHRVVDGAAAAEFLRTFKTVMEEPGLMLV